MWQIKRSKYRAFLKYYRSVHQFQSKEFQRITVILQHLRIHSASHSAFLSRGLREKLGALVATTDSVHQFYQVGIEQTLKLTPFWRLKPIAVWDCYRVLHDQENINHFLSAQYFKMRPLLSQLSTYYGYGRDLRILGAHFVGRLKKLLRNLEETHQEHQRTLSLFRQFLVNKIGDREVREPQKYSLFKKRVQEPSGSEQFLTLIAHCNRPSPSSGASGQGINGVRAQGDLKR